MRIYPGRTKMFRKMVKFLLAVPVAALIVMAASTPAAAAEIRGYENIIIASGDVVNDDLYLAGDRVAIHGTVNGDVLAAGNTIIVDGTVNGDVIALGSTVSIEGDVTGSVRTAASTVTIGGTIGKDVVAAGSSITIQEASDIGRDLVFGASDIQVESGVTGNIQE
jgi:cytoskeletal protein CcmA (bactofilin family)